MKFLRITKTLKRKVIVIPSPKLIKVKNNYDKKINVLQEELDVDGILEVDKNNQEIQNLLREKYIKKV